MYKNDTTVVNRSFEDRCGKTTLAPAPFGSSVWPSGKKGSKTVTNTPTKNHPERKLFTNLKSHTTGLNPSRHVLQLFLTKHFTGFPRWNLVKHPNNPSKSSNPSGLCEQLFVEFVLLTPAARRRTTLFMDSNGKPLLENCAYGSRT